MLVACCLVLVWFGLVWSGLLSSGLALSGLALSRLVLSCDCLVFLVIVVSNLGIMD